MVEHIDKTRLNNNLRYRFDFLSKFIDFSQHDVTTLNILAPIIFPLLPKAIDLVYKKLYSFDVTKRFFHLRNDGFENFTSNKEFGMTLDAVQTEFRKDMLTVYLKRVLTQPEWNDSFLEYLSRVGQIHTNKGGSASINVDYIYMNALFCYLEQILIDIIWNAENIDQKIKRQGIRAISRFIWIQNDLLTMHYSTTWNNDNSCSSIPIVKLTKCFFI
ncbi:unnamed protein product [Rotaria sordida]|uniref:Globin-sensor domain-containing protein n=1 Tax=Rotaria sordida TaxID=392033 RepID=A0A820B3X5_9BILA|nr:unnamed protein product [Rotaria sordida]CAF1042170.1 unnamed protein product [Rotaria sordida]CAF1131019.1 unnamed protein product [Rotaria sordida]CAF4193074.1 unnamed protein product [Rotaria sordida]